MNGLWKFNGDGCAEVQSICGVLPFKLHPIKVHRH